MRVRTRRAREAASWPYLSACRCWLVDDRTAPVEGLHFHYPATAQECAVEQPLLAQSCRPVHIRSSIRRMRGQLRGNSANRCASVESHHFGYRLLSIRTRAARARGAADSLGADVTRVAPVEGEWRPDCDGAPIPVMNRFAIKAGLGAASWVRPCSSLLRCRRNPLRRRPAPNCPG